jgi:HNH endonuclease/AP2 domain
MHKPDSTPPIEYLLDYYNKNLAYQEDGTFIRTTRTSNNIKIGDVAGGKSGNDYININLGKYNGKSVLFGAHRLAFLIHYGYLPYDVEHKDLNKKNNRINNLRPSTRSQNSANKLLQCNSTSGYKGVSEVVASGKWRAYAKKDGRQIYLGMFATKEEAARAYDKKVLELFGEFARLNFPE